MGFSSYSQIIDLGQYVDSRLSRVYSLGMHIKTPAADAAALALFMAKGGAVKRVDAADADTMKRTARETYNMLKGEPEVVVVKVARVPSYDAENYAELEAEHYGACAAAGMSGDAATADWNYAKQLYFVSMASNGLSHRATI